MASTMGRSIKNISKSLLIYTPFTRMKHFSRRMAPSHRLWHADEGDHNIKNPSAVIKATN